MTPIHLLASTCGDYLAIIIHAHVAPDSRAALALRVTSVMSLHVHVMLLH